MTINKTKAKAKAKAKSKTTNKAPDAYIDVEREMYYGLLKCYTELKAIYDKYGNTGDYVNSEGLQQVLNNKGADFDQDLVTANISTLYKGLIERANENWEEIIIASFVADNEGKNDAIAFKLLNHELLSRVKKSLTDTYYEIFDDDDDDDFDENTRITSLLKNTDFLNLFNLATGLNVTEKIVKNIIIYEGVRKKNYVTEDFVEMVLEAVSRMKN